MNPPLKLLFDECIGGPLVRNLAALLAYTKEQPTVQLVLDYVTQGTHDEDWVPQMAAEGWIVVTGDSGQGGTGKGEKLPFVCARYGVTHVMYSPKFQQRNGFEKVRAFISVWEEICELPAKPKGSGWLIRVVKGRTVTLQEKIKKPRPTESAKESDRSPPVL